MYSDSGDTHTSVHIGYMLLVLTHSTLTQHSSDSLTTLHITHSHSSHTLTLVTHQTVHRYWKVYSHRTCCTHTWYTGASIINTHTLTMFINHDCILHTHSHTHINE